MVKNEGEVRVKVECYEEGYRIDITPWQAFVRRNTKNGIHWALEGSEVVSIWVDFDTPEHFQNRRPAGAREASSGPLNSPRSVPQGIYGYTINVALGSGRVISVDPDYMIEDYPHSE